MAAATENATENTEASSNEPTEPPERMCAKCLSWGKSHRRCGRCKDIYYCSQDCQRAHWDQHKIECLPPEKRPPLPAVEVVAGYVDCETYEDCRDFLIKHQELINRKTMDQMYERAWMVLRTHPPQFGTRFIRNAQIIQYLLDLRKISSGQQDISLFFHRILDPQNAEYRKSFEQEYKTLVTRVLTRIKEKEKEKETEKENETEGQEPQQDPHPVS